MKIDHILEAAKDPSGSQSYSWQAKENDTLETNGTSISFQFQDVFNLDNENGVEDTPILIDRKDNIFIMFNPK